MNARLAKEFRPLWLPCGLAALGAICYYAPALNSQTFSADFKNVIIGLAGFAFGFGVLLLCALPMGIELNERTLVLLLSQPAERTRLWRDKLIAAIIFTLILGTIHAAVAASTGHLNWPQFIICVAATVTALCSVGYHVLAAGSMIVGIAAALGTPWAIGLSVHLFVYYVLRIPVELTESQTILLVTSGCAIYSGVFLWLSKRQFATLELKVGTTGRVAEIPQAFVPNRLAGLTQARPLGAISNLIRKEISLQKPIFLVGAIFTACWLATLLLMFAMPGWQTELESVLNGLSGSQVILMALLTGCIAVADDRALGTAAWHLSLPISVRKQWFVKLFVAAGTFIAIAIVLPALLAILTSFKATVGMLAVERNTAKVFLVISLFLFAMSFWSAVMSRNTIRAVLVTMGTLVATGMCAAAASWLSTQYFQNGLQNGLIARLANIFHVSLNSFGVHARIQSELFPFASTILVLALVLLALIQSARLFRHLELTRRQITRHCMFFGLFVFLGVSYAADLEKSISRFSIMMEGIQGSFSFLPDLQEKQAAGQPWTVAPWQLARVGGLGEDAEHWLEGSTITVYPTSPHLTAHIVMPKRDPIVIEFPIANRNAKIQPKTKP